MFAARAMFVEKDARTLAREILVLGQAEYVTAFKGSAMKRAKLWMLQRNAFTVSMLWHPRLHADLAHRWLRGVVAERCAVKR